MATSQASILFIQLVASKCRLARQTLLQARQADTGHEDPATEKEGLAITTPSLCTYRHYWPVAGCTRICFLLFSVNGFSYLWTINDNIRLSGPPDIQ